LDSEVVNTDIKSRVKAEIDAGRPVWASTNLWGGKGHIVVIKGYEPKTDGSDPDTFLVNDPWPYEDRSDEKWKERNGEDKILYLE